MRSNSKPSSPRRTLKDLIVTAMLLAVLLGLEYAMIGIPNVQLTVVILMVYASVLPWGMLLPLVGAYVFLDNLLMGTLNIMYFVPMLVAWLFLVMITKIISRHSFIFTLLFATVFGFLYGWFFIPVQAMLYGINRMWPYFLSDLPFEVIMVVNNFITVGILFLPLKKTLNSLIHPEQEKLTDLN